MCPSQYAQAIQKAVDRQSKPTKIIGMPRHTSLNTIHCMKTSKYLAVIMSICGIWILLDVKSPAQGFKLGLAMAKPTVVSGSQQHFAKTVRSQPANTLLTQNSASTSPTADINKDLMLKDITITQDSEDKSLLTVKGFINNRSDKSHYVYYIVAKFISNDTAIKQTIIPVNIKLDAGASQAFTHEISTDSDNVISPETIKPLVVKYEYR
jgi:hypothetical protein